MNYISIRSYLKALPFILFSFALGCSSEEVVEQTKEEIFSVKESSSTLIQPSAVASQPLPDLMYSLAKLHLSPLLSIDSISFYKMCDDFQLDVNHLENREKYVLFFLTHKLFTAQGATTGSMGNILRIPYYWHYSNPNPRHKIKFTSNGEWLKNTPPPLEFKRYPNFAAIDRTPFLYLSDVFAAQPRYYSPECDTFSSFGWCSEREMAYTALLKTLGYRSKIYTMGIHCWSEFLIPMKTKSGETTQIELKVDNTYDLMEWKGVFSSKVSDWEKDLGTIKERFWYNQKASNQIELGRIKSLIVSPSTCERIENNIVTFLNNQRNTIDN